MLYNQNWPKASGCRAGIIRNSLLLLTGWLVGLAIRVVGALLIDGLILLPGLSALSLARDLRSALLLSSLFGISAALGGLPFSLFLMCRQPRSPWLEMW